MDEEYDDTELGRIADERIQSFQADSSQVEEFFSAQYLITTSQLENVTKLNAIMIKVVLIMIMFLIRLKAHPTS